MRGGGAGTTPSRKGPRAVLDDSPAYQAQHAEKAFDANHGRPWARPRTDEATVQAGMGSRPRESERSVGAMRAGNAAGAKGPHFRDASSKGEDRAHPLQGFHDEDEHGAP